MRRRHQHDVVEVGLEVLLIRLVRNYEVMRLVYASCFFLLLFLSFQQQKQQQQPQVRPLRLCFESKEDRGRWIEGIRFAVSAVRKEESRLLKSAGIVEMPASVSDILSESVTLKRWETRLENLVERYEEISEELRRILNPVNIAVPAPGARRDAVQSSVKLIAMILSRKDVKKNRSNTKKQEEEEEEEKKSDDKKTAEKLLLRISETFCEAPKVQDRAFQMFARAVTDERTPEGRLLWRWLDWLLSSTGNSEIQHRNQHTVINQFY